MKYHAKTPGSHSAIGEKDIVSAHCVFWWNALSNLLETIMVCEEIDEGEEYGEGLLHAEETVEWPFPVELEDWLGVGNTLVGDYVLAGVVAFGGAVPKEELMEESYRSLARSMEDKRVLRIAVVWPGEQFSRSQTCVVLVVSFLTRRRVTLTHSLNSGRRSPAEAFALNIKRVKSKHDSRSRIGRLELCRNIMVLVV